MPIGPFTIFKQKEVIPMRRFYAFGVLVATAVAAALGLKVTEARAHACPVPQCDPPDAFELELYNCASDTCGGGEDDVFWMCGICVPV